jgi:hypothetical protein
MNVNPVEVFGKNGGAVRTVTTSLGWKSNDTDIDASREKDNS